jgi:hypothetical protein
MHAHLRVLPRRGMNIIAQISHMLMTLNLLWGIWVVLKEKDYKAFAVGSMISVVIFIPFIAFQ